MLTPTSLLAIVLLSLHVADDVVRGYSGGGIENLVGILMLVVWLYATLVAPHRRWGRLVVLLGSVLAAAMPVLHFSGAGVGDALARSSGALFFVWMLYALGVTGTFGLLLAVRGMLSRRSTTLEWMVGERAERPPEGSDARVGS
jgi:hypothetical protein